MTTRAAPPAFRYGVGDDVVVRLAAGPPFNLEDAAPLRPDACPSWAVATISGRERVNGEARYVLTFQLDDDRCVCIEAESSIEGLA